MPAVLGDNSSTMLGISGCGEAAVSEVVVVVAAAEVREGSEAVAAGVVSNSSAQEDHKGGTHDHNYGGNRWPRQETLALLKIRSQMDAAFRDSSLKGPLWEEISRKLGDLGYYRSAKKCREKFENVYKYHRRTKEGRSGKPEGKTYRFFDELEAFDHQNHHSIPPNPQLLWNNNHNPNPISVNVIPQTLPPTMITPNGSQNGCPQNSSLPTPPPTNPTNLNSLPPQAKPSTLSHQTINGFRPNSAANLFSSSTSSTASDEEFQQRHKRKRKWKYFFRRLTKEVLEKQEKLQEKFLESIAKCERERMSKEEAWRVQEMARIDREHQILVQERSTAAAKDAAVIEFLHKISGQSNMNIFQEHDKHNAAPAMLMPPPQPQPPAVVPMVVTSFEVQKLDNGKNNSNVVAAVGGSSRWPRPEVEALINLRTSLDVKYQETGPKGSLWEEISAGMRRMGYGRSAKRCKEKWENINKYFKKMKESSKTRPEDSKTCPYFHQLEALYKEKSKTGNHDKSHIVTMQQQLSLKVQTDQQNVDHPNQEEDDDHDDEGGESTEEDQDHDDHDVHHEIGIVANYKGSSMEMAIES